MKAKKPDTVKVILADPRKTRSGTIADLWLPFASGRDLALINAIAYVIAHELDGARADVEQGTVTARWKYLDRTFIERHVSFGIHEDVKKVWVKTNYGGTRHEAWDLSYTAEPRRTYPDPKKKYASDEEIRKDLYRGFAIFLKFLEDYQPAKVTEAIFEGESPLLYDATTRSWKKISGPEAIRLAAKWFVEGYTVSTWCMGVNQKLQGTWTNATLHTLHLLTGKAVKPGRHSFSFTGQPNACGGIRAPGALCHALPYGRLVANPLHRGAVEKIWSERAAAYLKKRGAAEAEIAAGQLRAAIVRLLETRDMGAILRFGLESDLVAILKHPTTSIACDCGATTGPATHPRYYGSFPRVLGRYVRTSPRAPPLRVRLGPPNG